MLGSTNIVAFVPTNDADRARGFYVGVLGLRFVKDDGFALVLDANGIMIRVAKVKDFKPAQFTVLGWQVSDIETSAQSAAERSSFRDFRILQAGRVGNLDSADGRQGGVVQGSRWEYPVGFAVRGNRN